MKTTGLFTIAFSTLVLGASLSCKKSPDITPDPTNPSNPPLIITKPVATIYSTLVISGGEFTNTATITDKGIIWGIDSSDLTVSSANKISNGPTFTDFTDTIRVLQPNTTYYVKAFAIYSSGISYGAAIKFTTPPTLYVAGYHDDSAAYWKDAKLFPLAGGTYARSIYVEGNDVYVAGETSSGRAAYWKNGVQVLLTDGTHPALANSIYVVGNDVYVGGYELYKYNDGTDYPTAKYWKNGVAVSLTDGADYCGIIYSVFVVGNDVYAAGWKGNVLDYGFATYWKNGVAFPLSDSVKMMGSANSIYVKGDDVYVCGTEQIKAGTFGGPVFAVYWKNGMPVALTDGSQAATANSIFLNGSDIYISGYEVSDLTGNTVAKYWKNSIPVSLTDGSKHGNANSIFVVGSDVYVAGGEGYYLNAMCWKNDALLPLEINAVYSRTVSVFAK